MGFLHGELASLLWGGFFGFWLVYAVLGHLVQRMGVGSRWTGALQYRQEPPFPDASHPVVLISSAAPLASWPLFTWSVASQSVHSPGRTLNRVDARNSRLEWPMPRGKYRTQFRLQLTDALGLTLWRSGRDHVMNIVVHGSTVALPSPTPPALRKAPSGPRSAPRRDGEALDVRLYHAGDDVRRLHWALWAHSGQAWLRIPDVNPPPSGRKVWVIDVSMPPNWAPEEAEGALDARLAPVLHWIRSSPHWLLALPALGITCREPGELPQVLAAARVVPFPTSPDLSWSQGLSDPIVVISGPHCPGVEVLKQALQPRHRVKVVLLPLPDRPRPAARAWWSRPW